MTIRNQSLFESINLSSNPEDSEFDERERLDIGLTLIFRVPHFICNIDRMITVDFAIQYIGFADLIRFAIHSFR